ncbi:hypothetical protein Tco_1044193 [Tanacetum coccineum]|uniref:Uncharacterized protein n=1 Tax=Tanacetum coccineum TaxID=301880 RepID=A0ABQ5GRT4_9ASTR
MENEHELSYETLTRVYLGSYEHYKGVGAEVEHSKPGFELQGAKMVETGQNRDFRLRMARITTPGLRFLGDEERLLGVLAKLETSFDEVVYPLHAAAITRRNKEPCAIFKQYMMKIFVVEGFAFDENSWVVILQLENAHLKQTYKDLFESVQRSKVEIKQCDEVKVKDDFDEIETKNIELEYQVASLIKENEHLKLTYKNLFDSIKKTRVHKENLRATLSEFSVNHICGKEDSSPSSNNELEKESGENTCDNEKSEFQIKFIELEKVLTQQTKDFDDVKLELSNRTTKFEAYFEKHEKTKAILERQLTRKVDDSKAEKDQFLKEINHSRTQLENLITDQNSNSNYKLPMRQIAVVVVVAGGEKIMVVVVGGGGGGENKKMK